MVGALNIYLHLFILFTFFFFYSPAGNGSLEEVGSVVQSAEQCKALNPCSLDQGEQVADSRQLDDEKYKDEVVGPLQEPAVGDLAEVREHKAGAVPHPDTKVQ